MSVSSHISVHCCANYVVKYEWWHCLFKYLHILKWLSFTGYHENIIDEVQNITNNVRVLFVYLQDQVKMSNIGYEAFLVMMQYLYTNRIQADPSPTSLAEVIRGK